MFMDNYIYYINIGLKIWNKCQVIEGYQLFYA